MADLAQKIRNYMDQNSLSLRQLQKKWRISRHTISEWLNGRDPSDDQKRFLNLYFIGLYEVGLGPVAGRTINPESAKIVDRIKAVLAKGGFSKTELGAQLGCKRATLKDWLNGHNYPNPKSHDILKKKLDSIETRLSGGTVDEKRLKAASLPAEQQDKYKAISIVQLALQTKLQLKLLHLTLSDLQSLSPEARELFRQTIKIEDMAALGSMLTSICDEKAFERWKAFSTYQIGDFEKRNGG